MSRGARDDAEIVYGFHPVLELLERRTRGVERVWVAAGRHAGVGRVLRLAREAGVPVSHLRRDVLERKLGREAVHQGVAATVAPLAYAEPGELLRGAGEGSRLLVLADGVSDPRNVGAIVRTAAAAGADGLVLAGEGAAGLTAAGIKVAAGAAEHLPVTRVPKATRFLRTASDKGFRAIALDPGGDTPWDAADLSGPVVLVAGGEERGARRGTIDVCDVKVAIPTAAGVESLNVAVAVGVLLFEAVRQRRR